MAHLARKAAYLRPTYFSSSSPPRGLEYPTLRRRLMDMGWEVENIRDYRRCPT